MNKTADKPKQTARKGTWGPLAAVVVTFAIYFGAQLAAGVIVGLYSTFVGDSPDQITQKLEDSVFFQFVFFLIVGLLTLGFLRWFMRHRGISLKQIGLGRRPKPSDAYKAVVTFGIYFLTLLAVMGAASHLFTNLNLDQHQQIGFDGASGVAPLMLVFVSLVILPPIVEESLVRGFLYGGLKNKLRPLYAALIASVIFAAAHLQFGSGQPLLWVAAIDTFVLSLFLIRLRETTGSLWSGMMMHFIKNFLAFITLFVVAS